MPESDAREYVEQTIDGAKELTWIAELGKQREAIAKIGAMAEKDGSVLIYGFCVRPGQQGKGYGRAILRETIACLRRKGQTGTIQLEVSADNEHALGLYESCGFITKTANDYYVYP